MNYLELTLDGVLQYYAATQLGVVANSGSTFKTEKNPTRSSMVGMIGCVLGYPRKDTRLQELRKSLSLKYVTTKKGSILRDLQVAKPMPGEQFSTIEGKLSKEGKGVLKYVEYLQDYAFKVYVGADDKTLKEIYDAFCNPVFSPCLGKRSCSPSKPIVTNFTLISDNELENMNNVYDCP